MRQRWIFSRFGFLWYSRVTLVVGFSKGLRLRLDERFAIGNKLVDCERVATAVL